MLKFIIIFLVIFSTTMIKCRIVDLPISSGCEEGNSDCQSGTECCSGVCRNKKCFCKGILSSCNNTNIECCPDTQCRTSDKRCCRPSGQQTLSPSECCFSSQSNEKKFLCCSGHAQSCLEDSDCCQGSEKCSKTGPWINICLQP